MNTKRLISGTVVLALTSGAVLAATPAQASGETHRLGFSPRVSKARGMNIVPTPDGMGLGTMNLLINPAGAGYPNLGIFVASPACQIGAGCAARRWAGEFIGTSTSAPDPVNEATAANPNITSSFLGNVGIAPTKTLAKQLQAAATNWYNYELHGTIGNGTSVPAIDQQFTGSVTRSMVGNLDIVAVDATRCDWNSATQVCDPISPLQSDPSPSGNTGQARFVQIRKGAKIVMISMEVRQQNGNVAAAFGPDASLARVIAKAQAAFNKKKAWAKVPVTVLSGASTGDVFFI